MMHLFSSMSFRSRIRQLLYYDWLLFAVMLLLCAFSLAALYGIATGFETPNFINLQKQFVFILIGLGVMVGVSSVSPQRFHQYSAAMYVIGLLLLIAVLIFGQTLRGTTGWFTVGTIGFQPVELAKLALIVILARVFSSRPGSGPLSNRTLVITALLTGAYATLTLAQPDFGSAILLVCIWVGMAALSGITWRQVMVGVGLFAVIATIGWSFILQPYQQNRILTFLNPSADPYGRGYQVRQSIIAIGSGQWFGRGLGSGSQSQLKFIPASQTDFIFAVIGEELGFFGAVLVLGAYVVLFLRCIVLVRRASDDFASYLIIGISILLFSQVVINIGMNIGVLPVTGIGLPFLSYGGSYLVMTFAISGVAQAVATTSVKYRV